VACACARRVPTRGGVGGVVAAVVDVEAAPEPAAERVGDGGVVAERAVPERDREPRATEVDAASVAARVAGHGHAIEEHVAAIEPHDPATTVVADHAVGDVRDRRAEAYVDAAQLEVRHSAPVADGGPGKVEEDALVGAARGTAGDSKDEA